MGLASGASAAHKLPMNNTDKPPRREAAAELRGAAAWLFDLDNTLYPPSNNIFRQIERRMTEYVATYLSVGLEEALVVQKRYFRDFGTTMRGMMSHHGMDPGPFLEFVHTIDLGDMAPSPSLDAALGRLPGRKLIFTNASAAHAGRVMERLGVSHHFEYVFDIADAEYAPKPEPMVYDKLVERHGLDPARTVMIEDMVRNLEPAAALGMTTVWLPPGPRLPADEADFGYVDHVVDDLVAWLDGVAGA